MLNNLIVENRSRRGHIFNKVTVEMLDTEKSLLMYSVATGSKKLSFLMVMVLSRVRSTAIKKYYPTMLTTFQTGLNQHVQAMSKFLLQTWFVIRSTLSYGSMSY